MMSGTHRCLDDRTRHVDEIVQWLGGKVSGTHSSDATPLAQSPGLRE